MTEKPIVWFVPLRSPKKLSLVTRVEAPADGPPQAGGGLAVAEELADTVVSLPFHPYLTPDLLERIVTTFRKGLNKARAKRA